MFLIIPEGYISTRRPEVATHKMVACVHCEGEPSTGVYPVDALAYETLLPDVQDHMLTNHPGENARGVVIYLRK